MKFSALLSTAYSCHLWPVWRNSDACYSRPIEVIFAMFAERLAAKPRLSPRQLPTSTCIWTPTPSTGMLRALNPFIMWYTCPGVAMTCRSDMSSENALETYDE